MAKEKNPHRQAKDPSQNACKHGCRSQVLLLPDESEAEYNRVAKMWLAQYHPTSEAELELVRQVINANWRMLRAERCFDKCEFSLLSQNPDFTTWTDQQQRSLMTMHRYKTAETNNFRKARREVEHLQKAERQSREHVENLVDRACHDANLPPAQKDLKKRIVKVLYTPTHVPTNRTDGGCSCDYCSWAWGIQHLPEFTTPESTPEPK